MEYAIIFLPLIGSIFGYLGRSINKFFSDHKLMNLESYKDPKGKISSQMSVFGLPTTIIIDQHSNELARLIGGTDWNSEESIKFVNKILEHKH